MGVAGGNGLEQVDSRLTKKVIATEINSAYLSTCFRRYRRQVPGLVVQAVDLAQQTGTVDRMNFIWAALTANYIGIDNCLGFFLNQPLARRPPDRDESDQQRGTIRQPTRDRKHQKSRNHFYTGQRTTAEGPGCRSGFFAYP